MSIDTLRSDRLPIYGYADGVTPAIDAIARDGLVFDRAYAHAPLTLPSHGSMLTGLLPPGHGARDNVGYRLDPEVLTVTERLRRAGYRTAGFVSSFVLRRETGIAAGFEVYDDDFEGVVGDRQRPGSVALEGALAWLSEIGEAPCFLFLHLYEPHTPYDPPEPWASRLDDPYDGEIGAADSLVGRLVEGLRARGRYREALLVVASDHGEGLGDHGEEEHGLLLYREAIQVPLVVKVPGESDVGRRVDVPVGIRRIAPTLATAAGLDGGGSLLEEIGPEPVFAEAWYPRLQLGWSELHSVIDGDLHYVEGPGPELYDLDADPEERVDLASERRREVARLRGWLAERIRVPRPPTPEDDESRDRLAALGYVGGVVADDGPRPHPKEMIPVYEIIRSGAEALARGRPKEAISILEGAVDDASEAPAVWELLGEAYRTSGRPDDAIRAYERALRSSPGNDRIEIAAARVLARQGRVEEAEAFARGAMATEPVGALVLLSQIALGRGEPTSAKELASEALDIRPDAVTPRVALGRISLVAGDLDRAEEWLESARAVRGGGPPVRGLALLAGEVAARRGRARDAAELLREEIERFPEDPAAYRQLAGVYRFSGLPEEAVRVMSSYVAANPGNEARELARATLESLGLGTEAEGLGPARSGSGSSD